MSSTFPTTLDSITTGKSGSDPLTGHAALHDLVADAVNKLEANQSQLATFGTGGTIAVAAGVGRFIFPMSAVLISAVAAANTAPTGASIIVDVNLNGTTVFTTQANRPTITATNHASSVKTPDVVTVTAGDYLTVDIDQVGSTLAGSDLVVNVRYR